SSLRLGPTVQRLVTTRPKDDSTVQVVNQYLRQIQQGRVVAEKRCLFLKLRHSQLRLLGPLARDAAARLVTRSGDRTPITACREQRSTHNDPAGEVDQTRGCGPLARHTSSSSAAKIADRHQAGKWVKTPPWDIVGDDVRRL